jgi:transposase
MKKLKRAKRRFKGFTLGLDVHEKYIEYAVINQRGDDAGKGQIRSEWKEIEKVVQAWRKKGRVQVGFESSGSCYWVFDRLVAELGRKQVRVAHAGKVRVIAESGEKNDENDAWWVAYLLWDRRLPESYLPEGVLRELRIAGREYRYVTELRADLLRRIRSQLRQEGRKLPKQWTTSKVKRKLTREEIRKVEGTRGQAVRLLYREIMALGKVMRFWRKKMRELAASLPEVKTIQEEMPGLKAVTGTLAYGELGDPRRFKSEKAYAKATGLTPLNRESGGKKIRGPISKAGSVHARWAFTRAILGCLRCRKGPGLAIGNWVRHRMGKKLKKVVIVAAARKLAEGVWRLFNYGEVFDLARAFPQPKHARP